ncbi:hypothetical protein [Spirosoma koreense]
MKTPLKIIPILLSCVLVACINDGQPIYEKQLNGPYYLDAVDEYEDMSISIQDGQDGVGVIKATVFAVSQTDEFIIAKQHPLDETRNVDKSTTNYFIIPLKQKISKATDRNYYGPLSFSEFNSKKKELGIEDTPFSILFKELE